MCVIPVRTNVLLLCRTVLSDGCENGYEDEYEQECKYELEQEREESGKHAKASGDGGEGEEQEEAMSLLGNGARNGLFAW